MNKALEFFSKNKTIFSIVLFLIFFTTFLTTAQPAAAACADEFVWYLEIPAYLVDTLIGGIPKQLAKLATDLSSWVITNVLDWPVTQHEGAGIAFSAGWRSVRDLANMFIVLGFVIVGIATALRLQEYAAKKALMPLIIVAILINFSGLFVGLFVDASRLIMTGLTGGGPSAGMGQEFFARISEADTTAACAAAGKEDLLGYIAQSAMFSIVFLVTGLSFLFLAGLLIIRYAALGILYVLAPIAFIFRVFPLPKVKVVWERWWASFLKWIFIGIILTFFIKIAAGVLNVFVTEKGMYSDATSMISYLFVVLAILITGLYSAIKTSGAAGAAVAAVGGAALGLAMGAAKVTGVAGMAQRAGQGIKDKATAFGEKAGFVKKGTLAGVQQNRLKDSMGRMDQIQDNNQLAKIAGQRGITATQRQDRAAAAAVLAKRNEFGKIDVNKQASAKANALSYGVSKDTFAKISPEVGAAAKTNEEAIQHIRSKEIDKAVRGGLTRKKAEELVDLDWKLSGRRNNATFGTEIEQAHKEMRQAKLTENALGLSPLTDDDAVRKLREEERDRLLSLGKSEKEIIGLVKGFKPSDQKIAQRKEKLSTERIAKGFAKLDTGKIRELPKEALSSSAFRNNVGTQAFQRAMLEMSGEKVDELKKTLPDIEKDILSELGIATGATKAQRDAALAAKSVDDQRRIKKMIQNAVVIKRS